MSESLSDVRQEAKNAFKYWGVFLEVQRRRVLKHVNEAAIASAGYLPASVGAVLGSEELSILQALGLPLPTYLDRYLLPALTPLAASGQFSFWAGEIPELPDSMVLNLIRTRPSGVLERAELMRATSEDTWYLHRAAKALNRGLEMYGIDLVFNAAKLWASFHEGAVVLPFVAVTAEVIAAQPDVITEITALNTGAEDEEDFRMVIDSFQGADDW